MRKQTWKAVVSAAAICAAAALPTWAATVAWKSNAQGYMNVASNWAGDALPQDGDTLDMSILTSPSNMYVGDFGDERRFETMTLWRTSNQLVLREGTLRLQYLTYSSGSVFGLSSAVVLDVSGKITSTGSRFFAGCGDGTVIAGEIENAGGNAFMCNSSSSSGGLVVKTGKFTISNSGYLSLSSAGNNSSYGVNYVVGAGGLSFGDGATSSAFYQNSNKNKVRIDPSADYTLAVNPARESAMGDNLAFMCHESTTYFGTTDYYDNTQPRTVTFAGGIGADSTSGRNVIVDGIGTLVFNACKSGSHEFNGALTVKDTATLLLLDTAAPGKGTKTFEGGTTFKVEQTSPTGIVELKGTLTLAANSILDFDLAANATTSALRVAGLTLPASGTVKVKIAETDTGRYALVENLPSGTTADKFTPVYDSSAAIVSLCVEDDRLIAAVSKKAIWKSNVAGDMSDSTKWVDDYVPQDGDTPDLRVIASSQKNVYIPNFGDERRFETLLHNGNVMLRSADGPATNMLRLAYLTYSAGSTFGLGGAAGLDVAGKLKCTGDVLCFGACGAVGVWADEFEYSGRGAFMCKTSAFSAPLGVTVRKFTISGSGNLYLTTQSNNNGYGVKYVVGSGGFTFADGCGGDIGYSVRYSTNTARIDPSADYSIGINPNSGDNLSFKCMTSSTVYFGTTDANDRQTPRTVTCEGGIGGDASDTGTKVYVDGNGTFVFNSAKNTLRFPGSLQVRDTATLLLRDTATTAKGSMTFAEGTTLKVEQTRADGSVELGGALTLSANSTLDFDLAANATTSALKVASLTMPASGKVRVKASGVDRGGSAVLIDNLPAGTRANQFEFVGKPYDNATLVVRNNKLMVDRAKGLVIIIAGGKSASPAPVTAKILFAGDSTLDDYGRVVNPFASWGTTLEDFMRSGCSVDNYAKSGASTKSFRANGYWSSLLAAIRPGDFVGIQFGHNDQKAGSNFAAPDGLFRDNVRQFVSEVRALGGKPILLSPIVRGTFDDDGNLYEAQLDNGTRLSQYATAMRELSVELGTDFVDMNALTHDLLVELGKEESAKLFAASAGKSGDYTHPIPAGADAFARLFVKNVKDRGLEVAALFS